MKNQPTWTVLVEPLFRVSFVALGWAWGLMLFPKSEDVLNVRQEREDLDYITQLTAKHN